MTAPAQPGPNKLFIRLLAFFAVAGLLVAAYFLKHATMLEDSYKRGMADGVASFKTHLEIAQKRADQQTRQISQLQDDLATSNSSLIQLQREMDAMRGNLESVGKQKDRLTQNLKKTRDSQSEKISAVKQSYEKKIKRLMEEDQKKIEDLMAKPQQKKVDALTAELASVQKDVQEKDRLIAQLQGQVTKADQELQALLRQKETLAQNLKEAEEPFWMKNVK